MQTHVSAAENAGLPRDNITVSAVQRHVLRISTLIDDQCASEDQMRLGGTKMAQAVLGVTPPEEVHRQLGTCQSCRTRRTVS